MGFYKQTKSNEPRLRNRKTPSSGTIKWIAAIVVSAMVGSGTTLVLVPLLQNNLTATTSAAPYTSSVSTVSATPTSVTNVTVADNVTNMVKQVEPAVMAVVNYQYQTDPTTNQSSLQEYGVGTGVYFSSNGSNAYVVTNNHVVQGANALEVVLQSGKHVKATVVGTDQFTDLAVIKIPVSNLPGVKPLQFVNSNDIQAGAPAIAIGTPMGLDFTESVTEGIVSATNRLMPVQDPADNQTYDYQPVIQTDASINPGNSGGPLLNATGQVMGINSSKIVEQDVQGMGFAIPSNEVITIANELIANGHAVHPALGIEETSLSNLPQPYWPNVPVQYGVVVESVTSTQAKQAGLKPQDVIVAIDGQTVNDDADLRTDLFKDHPGQVVKLTVYRGQQKLTLSATLTTLSTPNTTASGQTSSSQQQQQIPAVPTNPYGSGTSGGSSGGSYGSYGSYGSGSGGSNSYGGSGGF